MLGTGQGTADCSGQTGPISQDGEIKQRARLLYLYIVFFSSLFCVLFPPLSLSLALPRSLALSRSLVSFIGDLVLYRGFFWCCMAR